MLLVRNQCKHQVNLIMISVKCTGDFAKTFKFLEGIEKLTLKDVLNKYGKEGVKALSAATPVDTGNTASQWGYKVTTGKSGSTVTWTNDSVNKGIPIVILLQYGHSTKNGGYVSGVDFINPAMKTIFNNMADSVWREVIKL